jgi:hypothetical protein
MPGWPPSPPPPPAASSTLSFVPLVVVYTQLHFTAGRRDKRHLSENSDYAVELLISQEAKH